MSTGHLCPPRPGSPPWPSALLILETNPVLRRVYTTSIKRVLSKLYCNYRDVKPTYYIGVSSSLAARHMVPSQIDEKMELYSPHMFSVLLLLAFYSQLRWSSAVAYGRAEPSGNLSPLGGLQFLSFFPCTTGVASRSCDVFLYPAALLAVKHINLHERTLKFPEYGINVTLNLLERETRVSMTRYQ